MNCGACRVHWQPPELSGVRDYGRRAGGHYCTLLIRAIQIELASVVEYGKDRDLLFTTLIGHTIRIHKYLTNLSTL